MSQDSKIKPYGCLSLLVDHREEEESDDFDYDEINKEIARVIESQSEISRRGCKI
jgi:hypothetical protein